MTRVCWKLALLLPGLSLLFAFRLARAQTAAFAYLSPPDSSAYPRITTYLSLQDDQGFIEGLQLGNVRIRENDQQLPASQLTFEKPGARLVVAISPGPSFDIRDSLGNARYSYLVESLRAWSSIGYQSPPDELSLIAAGYPEVNYLSSPRDWFLTLEGYQPNTEEAIPNLDTLSRAMDVASGATPRPGMGRAVLFITAPQDGETTAGLQSIVLAARQTGIRIYVWMLASPDALASQGSVQLQNAAEQTGGAFFAFSGVEDLPGIDELLKPLRSAYAISYDSKITASGAHQVSVEISTDALELTSQPASFNLKVVAPNPIFVSLPAVIQRAHIEDETPTSTGLHKTSLEPAVQPLEILVEFPDSHPRPLVSTSLYVDGALVARNTSAPFEAFTWDLRPYTQSGKHYLRLEAVDSLGMVGTSIDSGVQVDVEPPPRNILTLLFTWQNAFLAGVVVLLAGSIVILLLVLGGRLSPHPHGSPIESWRSATNAPPTRPRAIRRPTAPAPKQAQEPSPPLGWLSHLQIHKPRPAPQAPAFLTPLSEADDQPAVAPIPLHDHVILFGRDSLKATLVLEDGSVDGLHARLQREEDVFRLMDAGSIAGTWVNFVPVPPEGTVLEHGDCINIGRVGFRFTLRDTSRVRKPVVIPLPVEMES